MNNAIYWKAMENLRNRISVQLVNNENDYLKCTSKPSYMSHKIFDNNLIAMHEGKLALKFNKPAYIWICILELIKVLMYEFHYDYIKNISDNKSKLLFIDTDNLWYQIKLEDVYEDFTSNKEIFDFTIYLPKSKQYDNSNNLIIEKMKDETGGVAIEEFVRLNLKRYSLLIDYNEHTKAKGMNKNVVVTSHNEYKDVLMKKKNV